MKKVTAFVGSARKKNTYKSVERFLKNLQAFGDVDYEIVRLSDYNLGICRGCFLCFEKGEEFCPLKDDRDVLMDKIMASDGVIFATPNYSFQLSGLMKVFLDRFGFAFHRPHYFGKAYTSIVTQGIGGGDDIVKYLDLIGNSLGFNSVKGICVTALDPRTEKDQQKIDHAIDKLSKRFYATLVNPAFPEPTMFKLMLFRMGRTTIKQKLDDSSRDYRYYAEKGWFDSDYYYPTNLGLLKKVAGNIFDSTANTVRNILA
ncbi:MAG: flavodoxin family protein [Anaerolineales bacterium]|nr:flavodoxin family protein [Anaerolineales bacterium]